MPESLRGGMIALGNFDGFHLGHQAVAGEALAWARAEGRPPLFRSPPSSTTFAHSLEPSHVTRPLFPPLTPVTPAPRAPPLPSHIHVSILVFRE